MQAYLAEKYMSGPKAEAILARTTPKQKKKRQITSSIASGPPMFVDEDAGFGDEHSRQQQEEGMEIAEAAVASDRSFKRRKTEEHSGWSTVREGVKREESPPIPPDEQPAIVEEEAARPLKGGLIRPEDLRKSKNHVKQVEMTTEEVEAAQETVYRDATGRKIDMKLEKAEAARKKREREEKEALKMEWGKGLVQRDEEEKRRMQLEKNKTLPFSRHVDDKELNEELKTQERWNDPAAAFLTKKASKVARKPEYKGPPPPPNRFGIKPGYRWDGVDRGNGFEKKWFQCINERKRTTAASYEWSVDDM